MILKESGLHTVCEEALCPNIGDCYSKGTATFLILGDRCTRDCRFCAVNHGPKALPDTNEPQKVAETVKRLGLDYVVITSVTRDDLPDGGAQHFAKTIHQIHRESPCTRIEVLIPDFNGCEEALETVVESKPDVIGHNLETVPRLYPAVRPGADYKRSLALIRTVYEMDRTIFTKSGVMLGLGEEQEEIFDVLADLIKACCSLLWLGQYLQPDKTRLTVKRYIPPDEFKELQNRATEMGFRGVASGPFVRSSFRAGDLFEKMMV